MKIWDGSIHDTTNAASNDFLKINSCGFQTTTSDTTVIREKGRLDYHILILISGRAIAFSGNKESELAPGNCVLYAPNERQKYILCGKSTSLWLHFSGTAVGNILSKSGLFPGILQLPQSTRIVDSFTELIRRHHMPGNEDYANATLLELLYCIRDIKKRTDSTNEGIIPSILTYLCTNYSKNINLESLAKMSGYSKSRFSHLFAEKTGTTPIKYQNDIRLKVSAKMLLSTSLSVAEIAYSCGFDDPLYYSRLFRKKYGISPTLYRNK